MGDQNRVELTKRALKQLKSYPAASKTIREALAKLEEEPELGHLLSGSLIGFRSIEINVKGSCAFRAAYVFYEEESVCVVFAIGPHEGFYQRLERQVGD